MIKRVLFALAVILALVGVSAPANASTPCNNGECFASVNDGVAFQGYPAATPRNTCKPVTDNITTWINNTSDYRWIVFTTTNCTGTAGPIYPHTEGAMTGMWYRSIGSTYRTSSTTAAPAGVKAITSWAWVPITPPAWGNAR